MGGGFKLDRVSNCTPRLFSRQGIISDLKIPPIQTPSSNLARPSFLLPPDRVKYKNELLLIFESFLVNSGFLILEMIDIKKETPNFHKFVIKTNNKNFTVNIDIRNIGDAYLPDKPHVKRRQVGKLSFEQIPKNKNDTVSMLVGIKQIDKDFVMACWNPFLFLSHITNRSCYLLEESMEQALNSGVYIGKDCGTPVYICSIDHFDQLLDIYINNNSIE